MKLGAFIAALLVLGAVSLPATAATETVIYNFQGGSDGGWPFSGVVRGADGALYGTTYTGGDAVNCAGCGTVFKLSPPAADGGAWTETVLHRFRGDEDGAFPMGGVLIDADGALYGTTWGGGSSTGCSRGAGLQNNGCGTVFRLTRPSAGSSSWGYAVIHRFKAGNDGGLPGGTPVMDSSGTLYGTTFIGGNGLCTDSGWRGCGIVFSLTPRSGGGVAWKERVLHRFADGEQGRWPGGLRLDSRGALFGTSSGAGRCNFGCGAVFKLTPPAPGLSTWKIQVLHRFYVGRLGANPASLLIGDGGVLYGTTSSGGDSKRCQGNGCGTVFSLTPPTAGKTAWTLKILHRFSDREPDGAYPTDLVMDASGSLFGTTTLGGGPPDPREPGNEGFTGGGIAYKLTPPGAGQDIWTQTVLHAFPGNDLDSIPDPSDGSGPRGALVPDGDGGFYGATQSGGSGSEGTNGGWGTVFKLTP